MNLYDFALFHPAFFLCCPKLVSEVTAKIRTGHTKQRELQIFYIKSLVTAVEGGLSLGYICRTVLIILKKGWAYAKDFFFFFFPESNNLDCWLQQSEGFSFIFTI